MIEVKLDRIIQELAENGIGIVFGAILIGVFKVLCDSL
ncbi:hypothetical protein AR1Y2_1478 [Anaerostipes rhamnosivorans]|uniref:Uncharacterized protein n=1 Tax=Anaerostipes rhamnosivorans TaxID=1229621 RepID=A0A4P8IB82_9FIRM|nr:hypothetical protein AR1Y2_1478 [Anaerostipes rhamnosivorans]